MFEIVGREEELAALRAFVDDEHDRAGCARARGRGGHREVDALARGRRACPRTGIARPLVATGRGGARPRSRGAGRSLRRRPRRRAARAGAAEAARARGRAPPRGGGRREGGFAGARDGGSRLAAAARRGRAGARRDRRRPVARRLVDARARVRAAKAGRGARAPAARPAASTTRRGPRASSRRSARRASGGCRWDRSASARSIDSCATGSAGPSRARRCSASTRDRAETRSSRWSWPAFSTRTSTRCSRSRFPETLEELVRARISGLPASTREALALASAVGTTFGGSPAAGGRHGGRARAGGRRARDRARERDDPLHATRCFRRSSTATSARSGGACTDVSRRSSTTRSSAPVTSRSRGSRRTPASRQFSTTPRRLAADRGASAVAAELAEQALRLTPPDERDERRRRALAAARAHHAAGEWTRARTIATDLLAETEIGSMRAEALVLLAELESADRAVELLEEALREAASRPALQSAIHCRLAWATRFRNGFDSHAERRSSSPRSSTTTCSGRAPSPCRPSSAGSPATRRRRAISWRGRATSRPPSAASNSCRRRRSPS